MSADRPLSSDEFQKIREKMGYMKLDEIIETEDIALAKIEMEIKKLKNEKSDILKRKIIYKLEKKKAQKQEIFYLRTKENKTYRQIGRILSMSHEAVRNIFLSSPVGNFYCKKGVL